MDEAEVIMSVSDTLRRFFAVYSFPKILRSKMNQTAQLIRHQQTSFKKPAGPY